MSEVIELRPYQEKALKTCDGVIQIANNEMLVQGDYVTYHVEDENLARQGSICGGHKACLVGSIYIGHGLKPWRTSSKASFASGGRKQFMQTRPALRLAYDAFNRAAFEKVGEPGDYGDQPDGGWAEWFFESHLSDRTYNAIREEVIVVANRAKELIREGVVT